MKSYTSLIVVASTAVTALLVWRLGFLVRPWLSTQGLVDHPNERSSHSQPTLRGGGVAIVSVIFLGGIILAVMQREPKLVALMGAALFLGVVSLVDDWRELPVALRFVSHAAAAVCVLLIFNWPDLRTHLPGKIAWLIPSALSFLLFFLWIVGSTNAFNFMDGINGIAAGQATVTAFGSGLLSGLATDSWINLPTLVSALIGGAAAGFLPHNFPRAKMFMGDVGSASLGFLLATVALWSATACGTWLLVPLALLHANFVLDTSITMLRRVVSRETWYVAHREHFYQRLVRSGKSHAFVTVWEMGLQAVVLLLMVAYLYVGELARLGLIISVIALWLAFFCYCEIQFRRFCASQGAERQVDS